MYKNLQGCSQNNTNFPKTWWFKLLKSVFAINDFGLPNNFWGFFVLEKINDESCNLGNNQQLNH